MKRKFRRLGPLKCKKCEHVAELEKLKKEIQITRDYILFNNLQYDLLSYCARKEKMQEKENGGAL